MSSAWIKKRHEVTEKRFLWKESTKDQPLNFKASRPIGEIQPLSR